MKTIDEAKAAGMLVDTFCFPHVAYTGPRFQPVHIEYVMTKREAELTDELHGALQEIKRLNEARRVDTLTPSHYLANAALASLWKMLGASNQTDACAKLRELLS